MCIYIYIYIYYIDLLWFCLNCQSNSYLLLCTQGSCASRQRAWCSEWLRRSDVRCWKDQNRIQKCAALRMFVVAFMVRLSRHPIRLNTCSQDLPSIMLHHHVMDDVRNARWSHYLKERLQREAVQNKLLGLRGAKMMLLRWCSSGRKRFLHEGIDLSVIFFIEYCLPRLEDTCTQIADRSSVIVTNVDRCCFHATNAWLLAAWIWSEQLLLPGQVQRPGCTRLVTIFCKQPIKTRNLYMYI